MEDYDVRNPCSEENSDAAIYGQSSAVHEGYEEKISWIIRRKHVERCSNNTTLY